MAFNSTQKWSFLHILVFIGIFCTYNISAETENASDGKEPRRSCYSDYQCGSNEYCDVYGQCSEMIDEGLAIGVLLAIVIGIPLVICVSVAVCCVYCSCCYCYRRRHGNRMPAQAVMAVGSNQLVYDQYGRPGYLSPTGQFIYTTPMNEQSQFQGQPPPPFNVNGHNNQQSTAVTLGQNSPEEAQDVISSGGGAGQRF